MNDGRGHRGFRVRFRIVGREIAKTKSEMRHGGRTLDDLVKVRILAGQFRPLDVLPSLRR